MECKILINQINNNIMKGLNILDNSEVDESLVEISLDERRKAVVGGSISIRRLFQFGSVITIVITLSNALAHFAGFEDGSNLYFLTLIAGAIAGGFFGFKLEQQIETFLTFAIKHVYVEGWKASWKSSSWLFAVSVFAVVYGVSFTASFKSKTIATNKRFATVFVNPLDALADITGASIAGGTTASGKQKDCESLVNKSHDDLLASNQKSINAANKRVEKGIATHKDYEDIKFLEGGRKLNIEKGRQKALTNCAKNSKSQFAAETAKTENLAEITGSIVQATNEYNNNVAKQNKETAKEYNNLIGGLVVIFGIGVFVSTLSQISNEDNGKK